jgi:creatinine amidohydrolase
MRWLGGLRAPEVGERIGERSIVIQPVGAIEQHGPHLPLDTDLVIPVEAADALAAKHGDDLDLWLLPPIAVSRSNEHAWAPGTLSLSARTLLSVVEDLGRSVAALPARRLVFLNGHGGNSALLNVACREIRLATGLLTFLVHPMLPPDQGGESAAGERGMGVHGGLLETSLMLHLAPETVRMDLATVRVPEITHRHVRFGGAVTFGWTSDDFGPDGHIGDPTGATAGLGRSMFEQTVSFLGEAMAEVAEFDLPA